MNRNNIWIHVGIAVVLITLAAVLGQIERWKTALSVPTTSKRVILELEPRTKSSIGPEVLVRFKYGTTLSEVRSIASRHNDKLTDEIEAVEGLTVIDDLDNADAQSVA